MPSLPALSGREVVAVFESLGWQFTRQSGSHLIMTKAGERGTLAIPNHKEVAKGTLRGVIRTAGISVDDFLAAL